MPKSSPPSPPADRPRVPRRLAALAAEAADCRACPLWGHATQTVFGEGPDDAEMMLVGEQPGDQEDRQGRPFVGPAGRLLDDALEAAGIERERVYVTNAVKHFKWTPRGKRRIHATPNVSEVLACKPWLDRELGAMEPSVLVLLGAVAVRSVLGPGHRIGELRGRVLETGPVRATVVTVHPSAVVRLKGEERTAGIAGLVDDLRLAAAALPS
jgi:uracil-DNA glycosylase family protein